MKVISLHKDESRLIKKAIANNREAQQRLFALHAPKMLSVCRQYINDLHYAEEAMLNGFLKVFVNLKKFKEKGSFEGWIRRIMINECISFLRKRKRYVFIDDETYFKEETVNQIETNPEISELQRLVDGLQDDLRVVFNLFAVEGYSHKEIAKLLKISHGVSRTRFFRARKQLKNQYVNLKKATNGK